MTFKATISPEEIEKLKIAQFSGETTIIEKIDNTYESAIAYLSSQKIIGFDTETKPMFQANVKRNSVALLQLASGSRAFLFRLTELGMPDSLCKLLSTKKVIKVGAAVSEDIKGLQRYTEFIPRGFVDLQTIGENWQIKEKSVRKMAAIVLGYKVSKSQQLSNWESDALSEAQINYAAVDAWVCRQMYLKLLSTPKPINEDEKTSNT